MPATINFRFTIYLFTIYLFTILDLGDAGWRKQQSTIVNQQSKIRLA
jgi:hypothetical protein